MCRTALCPPPSPLPPLNKLGALPCTYPPLDPAHTRPHMYYVPTCIAHQRRMWVYQLDSMNSV